MWDNIINFFKKFSKESKKDSKDTAKERLHLVLMQDRANVSADFLEMMKQEIIEVIKKYIDVDENSIDVKLTNKVNSDGTTGAPALYANIPIVSLKDETKKVNIERQKEEKKEEKNIKEEEEVKEELGIEAQKTEEITTKELIEEQEKLIEEKQENKEDLPKEEVQENKESEENVQKENKDVENDDNKEVEVK